MEKITVHFLLAILLFLTQNWIGSRTYSKGYIRFSLFDSSDEAFSLNYMIKVIGPIVFLIITVAVLQFFNLELYIDNILNVIYYYIGIRIILIVIYERIFIVNWLIIISYYISIILLSNIIYFKFISAINSLLPDFSELKNEIWLLIIIFIYQIGNGSESQTLSNMYYEPEQAFLPEFKTRKRRYVIKQYKKLKLKYESEINKISNSNDTFNLIIYAILIFENFNRPRVIRFVERIWVRIIRRNVTQGIMQKSSKTVISDLESVKLGTQFLFDKFIKLKESNNNYSIYRRIIKKQCPDKKYIRQVLFISKALIDFDSSEEKYSDIFDEIKSEFGLYDIID